MEELGLNPKRLLPCHTNHVKFMKPLKVYKNDELKGQYSIKPEPISYCSLFCCVALLSAERFVIGCVLKLRMFSEINSKK